MMAHLTNQPEHETGLILLKGYQRTVVINFRIKVIADN